jgi:hypothetical protein
LVLATRECEVCCLLISQAALHPGPVHHTAQVHLDHAPQKLAADSVACLEVGLGRLLTGGAWFDAEDFAQVFSVARNRSQETPQILSWPRPDSEK